MSVVSPARLAAFAAIAARVDRGQITGWTVDRTHPDPAYRMAFYLGAHMPRWAQNRPLGPGGVPLPGVPLFISASRLESYRRHGEAFPKARLPYWALDSAGFTQLQRHGGWNEDTVNFGARVVRYCEDMGQYPRFAAIPDWMCEPAILHGGRWHGQWFHGTGLTVRDHQELTVAAYMCLREEFDFIPWAPVIQGWQLDEYLACVDLYRRAGVDLAGLPVVGLGSVCRRESTSEIEQIVNALHALGIKLHGFGVKTNGLRRYGRQLASADSMAWSRVARPDRENIHLPGCTHPGTCANCYRWALVWRELVLAALRSPTVDGQPDPWSALLDGAALPAGDGWAWLLDTAGRAAA